MPINKLPQQKPKLVSTTPGTEIQWDLQNRAPPSNPGKTDTCLPVGSCPSVLLGESRGQKVVQLEFACPTASNPIWEHG